MKPIKHMIVVPILYLTVSLTDDRMALLLCMKALMVLLQGDIVFVSVSGDPANMYWPDVRVPCAHTPISDVCINRVLNDTMGFASTHPSLRD